MARFSVLLKENAYKLLTRWYLNPAWLKAVSGSPIHIGRVCGGRGTMFPYWWSYTDLLAGCPITYNVHNRNHYSKPAHTDIVVCVGICWPQRIPSDDLSGLFGAGVNHPSLQVMAERTLGLACLDNCEKGPPVGGLGHCLVKRTAQGLIGGRLTLAAWRPWGLVFAWWTELPLPLSWTVLVTRGGGGTPAKLC